MEGKMTKPSLEELETLAETCKYRTAPVTAEMLSDELTPISVMRRLMNVSEHCYILESAGGDEKWGRWTFLGYDPKSCITCRDGKVKTGGITIETDDPKRYIRQILEENRAPEIKGLPPFTGGLVGYFAYDYIKYAEPSLRLDADDSEGFNDFDLMLFDKVVAFDNFRQKIILICDISLDGSLETNYNRAKLTLREMKDLITKGTPKQDVSGRLKSDVKALFSEKQYCAMVEKAKKHIYDGDIFQIVLSNRLEADYEGSLFNTYRILRTIDPSPYMLYFSGSDMEVAGASPETLVKLEDGVLHTFPLAGTRPRGATDEEDEALEKELLSDPKELAEHNMLVDLGRNDIGRVSEFGSVEVERYHVVQRHARVMHIGSTVRGELRRGLDAIDAVDSVLPAGTLSGAPKLEACQLINDLEGCKRGIYGGAIGYLDFAGNLDCCIAIRIAYRKNGKVFVRSGAGIVADSVPENEYRECRNKAAAVVSALKAAESEEDL
jgi:anthranilate synthase component 1